MFNVRLRISIHTPVKGVTSIASVIFMAGDISIHTPVKGVTMAQGLDIGFVKNFNPHSREGSDAKR